MLCGTQYDFSVHGCSQVLHVPPAFGHRRQHDALPHLLALCVQMRARAVAAPRTLYDTCNAALGRILRNAVPCHNTSTRAKFEFGAMNEPAPLQHACCSVLHRAHSSMHAVQLLVSSETKSENQGSGSEVNGGEGGGRGNTRVMAAPGEGYTGGGSVMGALERVAEGLATVVG